MTLVLTARLEEAWHQQPPPISADKYKTHKTPFAPIQHTHCALLQVVHTHTHTHNACAFTDEKHRLCSTPSPWGRGPSNTDVALINWAQRREVGLETTWQFPAAYPPPPPSLPKTPPLLLKFGSRKSAGGLLGGVSAVWR